MALLAAKLRHPLSCVPTPSAHCMTCCRNDVSGALMLLNGVAWRQHLLLMVVSAKLLADTENMLQVSVGLSVQGRM